MEHIDLKPSRAGSILDVGFGNTVPRDRVVGILNYDSDPLRRQCQELEKLHRVIDATRGRKVKSVVFLDSTHVVLSAVARETLAERFESLKI
jgi:extracellular matrix regulatory protein A